MRARTLLTVTAAAVYAMTRAQREIRSRERLAAASLEALLRAIDANDETTGRHVRRVAAYALVLARAAGLGGRERRSVERVALFHDIGKIDAALFDIVHEPTTLSSRERELVATHPQRGADVLKPLARFYPDLAEGVLAHHERWDGRGYPRGLRGEEIPLAARVVAIADTYDVITQRRPYKEGESTTTAAERIREGRGTHFDPRLVDLFLAPPVLDRVRRLQRSIETERRSSQSGRRRGRVEEPVPDVTFRWRDEAIAPPTPGREPRTPP